MDVGRLRASWARIAAHGDQVALYFYSDLFLKHPEARDMFPVSMAVQRAHLTDALVRVVAAADDAEALTGHLAHLGRAHRKYGVQHDGGHYKAVGESLLATFEHFSAEDWTPEVTADWAEAYGLITQVMTAAAAEDEKTAPAWWTGTITSAERRVYDITVLHVRPEPALEWVPGQSVPVEIPARPRLWRWYSPANSPGDSGTLELHVRLTGPVSAALTNAAPGTRLCLGPAAGELCWRDTGRDVLLVAGSTGLAPLKAICGHLAAQPAPPQACLVFAARTADGLYDLPALQALAVRCSWLTVVPVVTGDPRGWDGETGPVAGVLARRGDWAAADAYVAGPSDMTAEVTQALTSAGTPASQIHAEDFGWREP